MDAVTKLLKQTGGSGTAMDLSTGRAPIYFAALHCMSEMGIALIRAGADVNGICSLESKQSALHVAVSSAASKPQREAFIALLLAAGANVNQPTMETDQTPLFQAAASGNIVSVDILLCVGSVDVNRCNSNTGQTAIFAAAAGGFHRVVERLMQVGGIRFMDNVKTGERPATIAAQNGHHSCVCLLRKAEASFRRTESRVLSSSLSSDYWSTRTCRFTEVQTMFESARKVAHRLVSPTQALLTPVDDLLHISAESDSDADSDDGDYGPDEVEDETESESEMESVTRTRALKCESTCCTDKTFYL
jgi:hypothetical protein